jgi:hypothetical protein
VRPALKCVRRGMSGSDLLPRLGATTELGADALQVFYLNHLNRVAPIAPWSDAAERHHATTTKTADAVS